MSFPSIVVTLLLAVVNRYMIKFRPFWLCHIVSADRLASFVLVRFGLTYSVGIASESREKLFLKLLAPFLKGQENVNLEKALEILLNRADLVLDEIEFDWNLDTHLLTAIIQVSLFFL